ncbi:hypothetical protein P0D72_12820 [Paraburkholderia sediminicola]|uniref:hypothetical protein n=1 Tax=Paraburkholderia sediminicola TaxID=458836 RepID=UPI0038B8F124
MFGINTAEAQSFYARTPKTFKAMQHLVMAMDDFAKSSGKKTWLGKDKSLKSMEKIAVNIGITIWAMRTDALVVPQSSVADVHRELREQISTFVKVFPRWADAYDVAVALFSANVALEIVRAHVEMSGFRHL